MTINHLVRGIIASAFALALIGNAQAEIPASNISVFASGFDDPRGIKFGPDGHLYVSEAAHGGTTSTAGLCKQAQFPGPVTGGFGARISKVSPTGETSVVVGGLPTAIGADGATTYGVADVAFVGGQLYAILQGGGCAHGHVETPLGLIRVQADGTWQQVNDLGGYILQHPVKQIYPDDLDPIGTWNALIESGGKLYAVEANHGVLEEINTTTGAIRRIRDLTEIATHPIPTSVTAHDGAFYVASLGRIPQRSGEAKVWRIQPNGAAQVFVTGLSGVVGITFDAQGRLLVLETTTVNNGYFEPNTGKLKRLTLEAGVTDKPKVLKTEELITRLNNPTSLTWGPDGALFVVVNGHRSGHNTGQVLKVNLPD